MQNIDDINLLEIANYILDLKLDDETSINLTAEDVVKAIKK